jgi:hypothetical protein
MYHRSRFLVAFIPICNFSPFETPDDVTEGVNECRVLIKLASSVASAAEKESSRLLCGISGEKEGIASIVLSGLNVMGGVHGTLDALTSVLTSVQHQNQKLKLRATELSDLSAKLYRTSSELASLLSEAIVALDESRVNFDSVVYKFAMRKRSTDHPKVRAKLAVYESEASERVVADVIFL